MKTKERKHFQASLMLRKETTGAYQYKEDGEGAIGTLYVRKSKLKELGLTEAPKFISVEVSL